MKNPRSVVASVGGRARVLLHGNPGTAGGRSKGGTNSLRTHRLRKSGFKLLRYVKKPRHSPDLAELLGIFWGDGHVDTYQATVTTNATTDSEHALFVQGLILRCFGITASLTHRRGKNVYILRVSSKAFCEILVGLGMVRGNKVRRDSTAPTWVHKNSLFMRRYLRGLFDTDGTVYFENHFRNGKKYRYISIMFSNRCGHLLDSFKSGLESIGLHPTQKTKYAVFLRREADIVAYFRLIGSSNPKHARKVDEYFGFASERGRSG